MAILAVDSDGDVTLWNPAAEEIFGWTEAEVLGEFNPVIPEEKRDEHDDLRERAFSGESLSQVELRRRTKDGERVDVSPDAVQVSVADNGPGVPDDRKEEVFGRGQMGLESPGSGIGYIRAYEHPP